MRPRRIRTVPVVIGIIAVIAVFIAAALLPGFALAFALMGLLVLSFVAVAYFDRHER